VVYQNSVERKRAGVSKPQILYLAALIPWGAAQASVTVSATPTGVQKGGQILFTATTDAGDTVVKVTFTYEGGGGTDDDTTAPFQALKTINWTTLENLTVTATFDFQNIPDQQGQVDVDVVDITLTGPAAPGRGGGATYTGRTSPINLAVSQWSWTYDTAILDVDWTDTPGSDDLSHFSGTMVTSGTVAVSATVLGVACTKSKTVTVMNRTGASWNTPVAAVEDNEPLWGAPLLGYGELLGQMRDRESNVDQIIVPQTSSGDWSDGVVVAEVTAGPCTGFWYVVSESLEIDLETVINRFLKSGGPPPEPGATSFYDYNDASGRCLAGDAADFVQAIKNHEFRGTPSTAESLEGHLGRIEYGLSQGEHPGRAVEDLVDVSEAGLLGQVNAEVSLIENDLLLYTAEGAWSAAGPNWGGTGSLGSGMHTRYDVDAGDYYSGCTFGPDHF
jgi:hypothetical protein